MSENDHRKAWGEPGEYTEPGRRQFLRGLAATGALASAGSLLAACSSGSAAPSGSPTAPAAGRKGGNLKVGLTGGSGSDTLDPHNGLTYLDSARAQSLYQPLLQLNNQAQSEFVLAEEISPHGSTSEWVIRVRSGITFHDGKPLTADDVIFTLTRILTQKLTGSTPLGPIDVKGLKKLDSRTVLVPMTSPYGSFIDQLAYWYYLYIVPVGFNPAQPNGTGPFKYKQANATTSAATRRQIEHEMQMIDFTQGGYIIPAYIDALDAYSTKITGYSPARVGQPLSDFDFENFSFV